MSTKSLQAGVRDCWLSFLDPNDNIAIGNNTTAIGAGLIRGSYPFKGIQTMPSGIPEGDVVPVPGDDGLLGAFLFTSDKPREFLMNFGQGDLELDALLQGTKVETFGGMKIGLGDPTNPVYATVSLIVNGRSIIQDGPNKGKEGWASLLYPVVQIEPLNRETLAGRTAGVFRYKATAQAAYNHSWGITLSSLVNGNPASYVFPTEQLYPVTQDGFTGNGVVTNWILNKTPIDTTRTQAVIERVVVPINTITPSTKTAALTPAIALNSRGVFVYEYSS